MLQARMLTFLTFYCNRGDVVGCVYLTSGDFVLVSCTTGYSSLLQEIGAVGRISPAPKAECS